jgi:hypothetical protein
MKDFAQLLLGKDLRSITKSNEVVHSVQDQQSFDVLFSLLLHHERTLVMRAADAIEKITIAHKEFLEPHKIQLLSLLKSAINKELKWHIAQLISRTKLTKDELKEAWSILAYWAQNPNESKIVRVNSLQGLFELSRQFPDLQANFEQTLRILEREQIPSLKARIKKLKKI